MIRAIVFFAFLIAFAVPGAAEPNRIDHGGDIYLSGSGTSETLSAARDVFATGGTLTLTGQVDEDIHATGFMVEIEAEASGDVYAAGGTVALRARIGEDLNAVGGTVRTSPQSSVAGNARLLGGTVSIDGPVEGALSAAGGEVILNAPIRGDVRISTGSLRFGPNAGVTGKLIISTPVAVDVPTRVASADQVSWTPLEYKDAWRDARETWESREYPVLPSTRSLLAGFVVSLAFFMVLGAVFLAFMPTQVQKLRVATLAAPGLTLLLGVIGLSVLFGLIPITAMTLVGLPFVPFGLLAILVLWTLGYLLGAYVVAMRVWQTFDATEEPSMPVRLSVLAIAVVSVTLLNYIPFVGWIVNFTLVLLGIGALTRVTFEWLIGRTASA